MTTVKRTINYFELKPILNKEKTIQDFKEVFNQIILLSRTKSKERFVINNEKLLYLTEIQFNDSRKYISGKLLTIRMEDFPELMNTTDDAIRDIEATEEEGIIETSHFILSYFESSLVLSLEFNQYGPRINDFVHYLEQFLIRSAVVSKLESNAFVRDDLATYKKRINKVSSILAKVHKNNIKRINEFDEDLFDAIESAANISEAEYVTLKLKYEYRQLNDTPRIREKIMNIINKLISNSNSHSVFSKFMIVAEDKDSGNKLKDFDLLNIWIKTQITVENKPKSRVIVSADILNKMEIELAKEFKGR
jgi:hypothetical protein